MPETLKKSHVKMENFSGKLKTIKISNGNSKIKRKTIEV